MNKKTPPKTVKKKTDSISKSKHQNQDTLPIKKTTPEQDRGQWIYEADREDIISILDNAPCGIVINKTLRAGKVLYINHESYNLMGYSVTEVPTGRIAQKTFSPSSKDKWNVSKFENELAKTGKAIATGKAILKDGHIKLIEIRAVLLRNKSVVSMWTDVTRREEVEAELRESESKFRTLFEKSPDAVFLLRLRYPHLNLFVTKDWVAFTCLVLKPLFRIHRGDIYHRVLLLIFNFGFRTTRKVMSIPPQHVSCYNFTSKQS